MALAKRALQPKEPCTKSPTFCEKSPILCQKGPIKILTIQKRPIQMTKETYVHDKRALNTAKRARYSVEGALSKDSQKRPLHMTKETYIYDKRALYSVGRAQYSVKRALSKYSHDKRDLYT